MDKYELTQETKTIYVTKQYHRIRARKDFLDIKAGDSGGWIEREENLSQEGNAWICDDAKAGANAQVKGNAMIDGFAHVDGNARVDGNAWVSDDAHVGGNAMIDGHAYVGGDAHVDGNAHISGQAYVESNKDYAAVDGFGPGYHTATFFRQKDGSIGVQYGDFYGTLGEFRAKVREDYSNDSDKGCQECLMLADLMECRFQKDKKGEEEIG